MSALRAAVAAIADELKYGDTSARGVARQLRDALRTNPVRQRTFELVRTVDVTGVSGTGVVALGVEFPDGTVALRWPAPKASTSVWADMATMLAVHGHDGATVPHWIE